MIILSGWNNWEIFRKPYSPTNYYLAIWDQDADGDLSVNNFKARFGCGDADVIVCNLETSAPSVTCNNDNTYTVEVPIAGINGEYVGFDPNATPTTSFATDTTTVPTSGSLQLGARTNK